MIVLSIAIPIITAVVVWVLRDHLDSIRQEREKLNSERAKAYEDILNPYIKLFAASKQGSRSLEKEMDSMMRDGYHERLFKMSIFGSDGAVRAYNEMMQTLYRAENSSQVDAHVAIEQLGFLMLEIRRDLGSKRTELMSTEMLESLITDMSEMVEKGQIKPRGRVRKRRS